MDDLISRQAAIDVINKIFPADPMRNDYTQGITCGAALATEYIKQLPSAQPEPRWIPVTGRLPDKGGDYLVSKTFHYGKLTQRFIMVAVYALNLREVDHYTFREDRPGWYDIDSEYGAYEVDNITAWMPLPEPYTEEGHD